MPAKLADVDAHEGPVYVAEEDALYFTSVPAPAVAIKRLALTTGEISVVREDANKANGMTLAPDGRLVVCEQGERRDRARISLVDRRSGRAETVVDDWNGRPFNSPNDVVVTGDGAIWFTDPSYGHLQGFRPPPQLDDVVYRHDPRTGETAVVASGFDKPNGLAFSPGERLLYVGDSGDLTHHIEAFDVVDGHVLARRRLFAVIESGYPDGLKVDRRGRVYCAGPNGVEVFEPGGRRIAAIAVPGAVNIAFGDGRIYITADTAVWSAPIPEEA